MLKLRLAHGDESEYFYNLRNDPDSVKGSGGGVEFFDHQSWWHNTSDLLIVAMVDKDRVGTLRVATNGVVSIVVAPEHRGKGLSTKMLKALVPFAKQFGHKKLQAYVKVDNARSVKAFERAKWKKEPEWFFEKKL